MSKKTRIVLQVNAMNALEALYALEMLREYIAQKYQNTERENEWIHERVEMTDGETDN